MKMITLKEIIIFHEKIIEKTGGSQGIRDIGLIESAINRPFQTYDGVELYPEIKSKISAITYSLINNHGFVDGNKRIGVSLTSSPPTNRGRGFLMEVTRLFAD